MAPNGGGDRAVGIALWALNRALAGPVDVDAERLPG
jgi:hypothetical protein